MAFQHFRRAPHRSGKLLEDISRGLIESDLNEDQQFAPELPGGRDWDAEEGKAADTIIDTVEAHAPGFRASIVGRQILSPKGLERKFGLVGGDIMHGNMSLDQLWAARPVLGNGGYRGPVKGLYMCGAGTHPGGGVTGAPGHNAAQVILRDRGFFAPRWR